jgi:uncharacterized protein (DUF58 family)
MNALLRWLSSLRRQRITGAGAAYTGGLALVAGAAIISGNNLLFLIVAAMVSVLMVSGLVGRLVLAGLELELVLPQHTFARRPVLAKVVVKNLKPWLPSFSVHLGFSAQPDGPREMEVYFPLIAGGEIAEQRVELLFPKRGSYRERSFEFWTRFPFGFSERREEVTVRQDVIAYPSVDARPGLAALVDAAARAVAQERGTGEDFYRIRPFEAHDTARHVDWKATAHTGSLQVREFSHLRNQTVIINLDLDVPPSAGAWFETAIECAAFLVYDLAGRGVSVRFITQEMDVMVPERANAYDVLEYLALVSPEAGKPRTVPDDESYPIVLSYFPEKMHALGWCNSATGGRMLGPEFEVDLER